jgi:hypothetical protein
VRTSWRKGISVSGAGLAKLAKQILRLDPFPHRLLHSILPCLIRVRYDGEQVLVLYESSSKFHRTSSTRSPGDMSPGSNLGR